MIHVVLLGDSIFDNRSYVGGDPDVCSHLQALAPPGTKVSLCAVDGSTTANIPTQAASVPVTATHLVLSVGGNDALAHTHVLTPDTGSVTNVLEYLGISVEEFGLRYLAAVQTLLTLQKPVLLCTIYNGNLPAEVAVAAKAAVSVFNDKIYQIANSYSLPVLELRRVCTESGDYANPIEPSSVGGKKIAIAILKSLQLLHQ
jgi:lysophospholipase L1-like esterase